MVCALVLGAGCADANQSAGGGEGDRLATNANNLPNGSNVNDKADANDGVKTGTDGQGSVGNYVINDTGQMLCYNNMNEISAPSEGEDFYGQDAQYITNEMRFEDNDDGTVTDLNTGLIWQQTPLSEKLTWDEAMAGAEDFELAGYDDWRLPTIKELYSLIDFSGQDVSNVMNDDTSGLKPFIDTDYFVFEYGDTDAGERIIDSQYASSTKYVSTEDGELAFGVNFADGRIKGYGLSNPRGEKTFVVMYVRGNEAYGENNFIDNGDGTITDLATGLMWMTADSGSGMEWEEALEWSENLEYAGYDDWRLPDAKELQSIVDYTRSPDTTNSAAIDPMFDVTQITDEGGNTNYPFYWTSTTHASARGGSAAVYIAFGEALGFMSNSGQGVGMFTDNAASAPDGQMPPSGGQMPQGPPQNGGQMPQGPPQNGQMPQGGQQPSDGNGQSSQQMVGDVTLKDVHGAGAQRSDPKTGDASDYPVGHGPQGDVVRIENFVRCVRSVEVVK